MSPLWPSLLMISLAAGETDTKARRFVLDPSKRIYKVGVNFACQTTLWTPVRCAPPVVGDPEYFLVLVPDETGRRFIVSAKVDQGGAATNVTFACDEDIRFSVEVTQVTPDKAALIVEFELNAEESARVRAAIEGERKRCAEELDVRTAELRTSLEVEAADTLMRGMLRRLTSNDDVEAARSDFVIVRVSQQVLVGDRGFVVFSVQNRTSKEVVVGGVEVVTGERSQPLTNVVLSMPERRVGPGALQLAVAAFDAPEDLSTVALVVREDGPRSIRVEDIDF